MNPNSNLNRSLAKGGTATASAPIAQNGTTDCPDCGAPLRTSTTYGWGTYQRWDCGRTRDDGPGAPCPNAAPPESVPAVQDADAPAEVDTPTAVAVETLPVVLVEGVMQEVKTIPELSKIDRLEEVLAYVEKFANMVVTKDDKKGADLADERRKLAKRIRVTGNRICKDERESAVEELQKIQRYWISTGDKIAQRMAAVEDHLAAQVKIYTDEKERLAKEAQAEKERREAEAKAEATRVLQAKIQRLMDLGAIPNMLAIMAATDAEFEAMVATATEEQKARIAQQETERIERETREAEQRARAELIEMRTAEASRAGILAWWPSLDALAAMGVDEFRSELAERIEERAAIDAERARLDAERIEREEAEREAEEERRRLEREENERQQAEAQRVAEAERIEAARPAREKAFAWLDKLEFDAVLLPLLDNDEVRARLDELALPILQTIQAAKREFQP